MCAQAGVCSTPYELRLAPTVGFECDTVPLKDGEVRDIYGLHYHQGLPSTGVQFLCSRFLASRVCQTNERLLGNVTVICEPEPT